MRPSTFVTGLLLASLCATSSVHAGLKKVIDCTNTQESDLNAAANVIANNWDDFEDFVEDETGLNIKNCMENRFESNGKVVCESSSKGQCKGSNAWASALNRKAHLCPGFLDTVGDLSRQPDRRACYAAILAHEFAHTCERFEAGSENIDDAAFDFYKDMWAVNINMGSCGMD